MRYRFILMISLLKISKSNKYLNVLYFMLSYIKTFVAKLTIYKSDFYRLSLNMFAVYSHDLETFSFNQELLSIDLIKIQELTFLSEYFLITALFVLTLFALFTFKFSSRKLSVVDRFQYDNQMIFLLVYVLICYLVLVMQQNNVSLLSFNGFNDLVFNDYLAVTSKLIIGIGSILYLLFITKYVRDQKLHNFEYYIILLTSIFGFFLLCCANDFITAYLAIELQGLAFYVLASFKKSSNFSVESGIKYFVLGSLSTALFLFGVTFIYGLSGSILLTDFKDFFIWSFSVNSFFLGFDSITQGLEYFQEKTGLVEGLNVKELNSLSEKLSLNFCDDNYSKNVFGNNLLIENSYQTASVEFLNVMEAEPSDHDNFIQFKQCLLDSNYYNEEDLAKFYGVSGENFSAISNVQKIDTHLAGASRFDNIYNLLKCCYSSGHVSSVLSGVNALQVADVTSPSYLTSVVQIADVNSFFFTLSGADVSTFSSMFDLNFAVSGLIIVLLALFFKLALAPFHLWSPDVYEGAPSSSTFFFMVLSKFGIFVFLLRLCYFGFYSFIPYWQFYSILVASASVFIGSLGGLKQRKLKSLLTYSSINNMGFVLLAFSVGGFEGVQVKFYYLIVYILASVCIWSVVLNLQLKKKHYFEKQNRDIGDLALLQESNSVVAQNLGITLFSLAGLPPMVGFLAKMGVFKALSGVSVYYFSVINILFSVIATFYYLRITKVIFFENILVGNLYVTIHSKKVFLINLLTFLLIFLFFNPMFLYLYSYKMTLFLSKAFF